MTREHFEQLLRRLRTRAIDPAQMATYTDEVRRKLNAQPSTVVRVRPQLTWWARFLLPVAAAAALAVVILPRSTPPLLLADATLVEEVAALDVLAPEGGTPALSEEDRLLLEEMDLLEDDDPIFQG